MRRRGELLERPFAHCYDTGGMRRTYLRGHGKILKRLLIHVAGFNLALVMRSILGVGTPRGLRDLRDLSAALSSLDYGLVRLCHVVFALLGRSRRVLTGWLGRPALVPRSTHPVPIAA